MSKYAEVALRATTLLRDGACGSPPEAWRVAARELMPGKPDAQVKGCPKARTSGFARRDSLLASQLAPTTPGMTTRGTPSTLFGSSSAIHRSAPGPKALWARVMNGRDEKAKRTDGGRSGSLV